MQYFHTSDALRRRRWAAAGLAIALGLGGSAPAVKAAGLEYPDVGTVAMGRGGADAAEPGDGLALQLNPAGLARQAGLRATVDARIAWQRLTFTPATSEPAVSNGDAPFVAPALVVSYGLGRTGPLAGLTFALGATGPSGVGRLSYPAAGAQRYALVSNDTTLVYWSAAVAAAFNRFVAAGATLQLVRGHARFQQAVWSGEAPGTERAFDTLAVVDASSGLIPTAVLGLTVRPTERVAVGLSWRPGFTFQADGSLTTELPAAAQAIGAHQNGTRARFVLPMPDVFRAGVLVRPSARWLVEADVVLERWSTLRTIELRPEGITISSDNFGTMKALPNIVYQKNFDDAFSVRVGGDVALIPGRLQARAGFLHETSAVPLQSTSVDFPNWERNALSIGASIALPRTPVTVDVAYAHHFLPTRTVADSRITQVVTPCLTPGCTDPPPTTVGDGRYEAALDVLSVSLRLVLDGGRDAP
jgi:long-subunit fatty acid transport protein